MQQIHLKERERGWGTKCGLTPSKLIVKTDNMQNGASDSGGRPGTVLLLFNSQYIFMRFRICAADWKSSDSDMPPPGDRERGD